MLGADFSLWYVQSFVCVMCSLSFVLCITFSVSASPLKRLVAALQILADMYIYIYIHMAMCHLGDAQGDEQGGTGIP